VAAKRANTARTRGHERAQHGANARKAPAAKTEFERRLAEEVAEYTHDPLGFALFAWPWGEPDTPLADFDEPMQWQAEILEDLGERLRAGMPDQQAIGMAMVAIQVAVKSGHGVGKSALLGMLSGWAMSTCPDTRGVITAGTEAQLDTKTQPEIAKWFRMMICGHWFEVKASKIFAKERPESWRLDFIPWNEKRPEAFAGLHNHGRRIFVLVDEASQVARIILETLMGALTDADTEIILVLFGNPTRNDGVFFECFNRERHRWIGKTVDSRNVPITNKEQIAQWIADYGEDSDFVRVRVRGEFPRAGTNQLISMEAVHAARTRTHRMARSPFVIGVDPARFGEDESVITLREGDQVHPQICRRELGLMDLAGLVSDQIVRFTPEAVFVDEIGMGAGVVDRLRQLGHKMVHGVVSSAPASDRSLYINLNAEMWGRMGDWIARTGIIPDDPELAQQLVSRQYGYDAQNRIQLEKKADMKKRGLSSPDRADSLALTFAMRLPAADIIDARRRKAQERRGRGGYDPFDSLN
jgi:hypothetical protein